MNQTPGGRFNQRWHDFNRFAQTGEYFFRPMVGFNHQPGKVGNLAVDVLLSDAGAGMRVRAAADSG